jgi:hypothetical protein
MEKQLITCPFKKVTIKHGNEPDYFGVFETTFKWCDEHAKNNFLVSFLDPKTVEIEFVAEDGIIFLTNVLTEYISRHIFVRAIDNVVKQSEVEISDRNKEKAYTMCVNIVSNFIQSSGFLLNWSLARFFQNNSTLNISLYEKLNMSSLRNDFEDMLQRPHALNYVFDSLERVMATENTPDENFLMTALITKSMVEGRPIFCFHGQPLHVWIENGKITFGANGIRFGIKDILCKELYEQGFNPKNDMTAVKIISLAIIFICPEKVIMYKGLNVSQLKEFIIKYIGVFGEIELLSNENLLPPFVKENKNNDK